MYSNSCIFGECKSTSKQLCSEHNSIQSEPTGVVSMEVKVLFCGNGMEPYHGNSQRTLSLYILVVPPVLISRHAGMLYILSNR